MSRYGNMFQAVHLMRTGLCVSAVAQLAITWRDVMVRSSGAVYLSSAASP
jgi:hypothetical protein